MYSLVLMAAVTASPATPACHWGKGCGCYGGGGGCYGGCYGYGYGCYGCYGGGYAPLGCYGCTGCWGGYGTFGLGGSYPGTFACFGGCYGGSPYGPVTVPGPASGTMTKPEPVPPPKVGPGSRSSLSNQAKVVVELPPDAKLYIDDQLMKTSTGRRVFRTPTLDRGQAYYYILRAEVERDGKRQTATKRVIVRAGEQVTASFTDLQTPAEATALADR